MSDWRDHATPDELARLDELKERRADASAEMKQIYERCRKRAARSKLAPGAFGGVE